MADNFEERVRAIVVDQLTTIERQTVTLTSDLWRSVIGATGQEFYFSGRGASAGATVAP